MFNFFKKPKSYSVGPKQYVVVRTDLSKTQQTIQAAHAAVLAENMYSSDCCVPWASSRPLILLQVPNVFCLKLLVFYLRKMRFKNVACFCEPKDTYRHKNDCGLTAISFFANIQTNYEHDVHHTEYIKSVTGNPVKFLQKWKA